MIQIETSDFVRSKRKVNTLRESYYALARLDSGLLGICYSSVPAARGIHFVQSIDFRSEILKSGIKAETFVANLD